MLRPYLCDIMALLHQMRPRWRPVALPAEHGGWALLLEPLLLGLVVAPSGAGGLLALAALGAFLCRHPLALALSDRRRGRRYPRTALAEAFAAGYGALALTAGGVALALSGGVPWPALLPAAGLAALQMFYDARRAGRALLPELAGAAALAMLAPAVALCGGMALLPALALGALAMARALPAIIYVRVRLRLARGEPTSARPAILAHVAGLAAGLALVAFGLLPWLAALALALLLARAAWTYAPVRAAIVGVQEVVAGLLTVALTAAGYWL